MKNLIIRTMDDVVAILQYWLAALSISRINIKRMHVSEALAKGAKFNSFNALKTALKSSPSDEIVLDLFEMQAALNEMGQAHPADAAIGVLCGVGVDIETTILPDQAQARFTDIAYTITAKLTGAPEYLYDTEPTFVLRDLVDGGVEHFRIDNDNSYRVMTSLPVRRDGKVTRAGALKRGSWAGGGFLYTRNAQEDTASALEAMRIELATCILAACNPLVEVLVYKPTEQPVGQQELVRLEFSLRPHHLRVLNGWPLPVVVPSLPEHEMAVIAPNGKSEEVGAGHRLKMVGGRLQLNIRSKSEQDAGRGVRNIGSVKAAWLRAIGKSVSEEISSWVTLNVHKSVEPPPELRHLDGKIYAMLSDREKDLFFEWQRRGRKGGVLVFLDAGESAQELFEHNFDSPGPEFEAFLERTNAVVRVAFQ